MDCKTARRILDACRPASDDLQFPEFGAAAAHVDACTDCLDQVRARGAFDESIAGAMRRVPVPDQLRERILARLDRQRIWHRRHVVVVATALAAAVLIAVGMALWMPRDLSLVSIAENPRRLGELVVAAVDEHDQRDSFEIARTSATQDPPTAVRQSLERAMKTLRVSATMTAKWPVSALRAIWAMPVKGQKVAVFTFDDMRGDVDIIAFPHNRFDVRRIVQAPQPIYSTRDFVVVAWSEGDTTYLAVLRGWSPGDLKPLVRQSGSIT